MADIEWLPRIGESQPYLKSDFKKEAPEEEEEDSDPSPLAMGLLQLGAQMMRDEGWKDRPITLRESIGRGIPAAISGYYNQDMINRQRQAERQQQEQSLEQERQAEILEIEQQKETEDRYKAFVANVESIPDEFFGQSADTASHRKQNLIQTFRQNPEKGLSSLNKIYEKMDEVRHRDPKTKTLTEMRAEEKSVTLEKLRKEIPGRISTLMLQEDVPEVEKQKIQTMYGNTETLTQAQLESFTKDFSDAMGKKKARDFTNEYERKFEFLTSPQEFQKLTPNEKRAIQMSSMTEDKKEALAELNKIIEQKKYVSDWRLMDDNQKTGTKVFRNMVTGEQYKEVSRGIGKAKVESMSGLEIKAKFPKWKNLNFDDNSMYTIETDMSGNVSLSGSIIDLAEKDPDKTKTYADNMRNSAVGMGLISDTDSIAMATWRPDDVIRNLNTLFIQDREKPPATDPNAGLIKSAEELNKEEGRQVYKAGDYYWDGKRWKDIDAEDAATAFDNEQKLRTSYDKNTKKFKDSIFAYNSIVKGYENSLKDPASAGVNDIMIVRSFLLMIEPNSVVRESEFATAAKSQGMKEYTLNLLKRMEDGAILSQVSRRRFFNAAMAYMNAIKSGYDIQNRRYEKIARSHNIDSGNVIVDIFADRPELQEGGDYAYEPYTMKPQDWLDLKNTHLEAPPGKKGLQKRESQLPPLNL